MALNEQVQDLTGALESFKKNVDEFQRSRVISQANETVNQIRSSADSEANKRQALQGIANQLVGQLAFYGTPATTIQQVGAAFGPEQIPSPEAAVLKGKLENKPELVAAGEAAAATARKAALTQQEAFQMAENEKNRQLQRDLLKTKVESKSAGKPIESAQVDKLQNLNEQLDFGKSLLDQIKSNPSLSGLQNKIPGAQTARGISDPEFAQFSAQVGQWFDQYRVAVTGAGASEGELKMLATRFPSVSDPPSVFKKKAQFVLDFAERKRESRLKTLQQSGRDTSRFDMQTPVQEKAMSSIPSDLPSGTVDLGVKLINGKIGKAYRLPNGKTVFKAQ